MRTRVMWLIAVGVLFGSHAPYAQQACENPASLKLPYTLVTSTGAAILPPQPKPEAEVYAVLREARYHGAHCDKMVVIDRAIAVPTLAGASPEWLREFDGVRHASSGGKAAVSHQPVAARSRNLPRRDKTGSESRN